MHLRFLVSLCKSCLSYFTFCSEIKWDRKRPPVNHMYIFHRLLTMSWSHLITKCILQMSFLNLFYQFISWNDIFTFYSKFIYCYFEHFVLCMEFYYLVSSRKVILVFSSLLFYSCPDMIMVIEYKCKKFNRTPFHMYLYVCW